MKARCGEGRPATSMLRHLLKLVVGIAWLLAPLDGSQIAFAQGEPCTDRAACGEVSPLIPMQSVEAVHMGLVWKIGSQRPKLLFHARFPEYTPNDIADPAVVDAALKAGALTNGVNDFNNSLRDVLHPNMRDDSDPTADSFQRLIYGGFLMRQGLSQSVPTRILANRTMERQLLFDPYHPDAFLTNGKFHTALLDEEDFALNRAAFQEVGYSAGNFYNTYCNGRVTLADGRVYVFGGHDMQSNNGLYKVNIFDPETERWVPRSQPCTRENWTRDPFGGELFAKDPDAPHYEGCNPLEIQSTQPSDPSDMRYARWYPTAIPLPDNTVLIFGGTDQDASVGPDPDRRERGRQGMTQVDTAFSATRVSQIVPEIYDPGTDTTIALENARKTFPIYPQAEVVQTGPGPNDWKVCTMGGVERVVNPVPPGGDRFFGPFTNMMWCLDVVGALNDPYRDIPAEDHWTLLDRAAEIRPYCCPTASQIELDIKGQTVSHRWFMISGRDADGQATSTVEVIDFAEAPPRWKDAGTLMQSINTSKTVLLPNGKVWVGHGLNRVPGKTFEEREGLRFQMYDPDTGTTTGLAQTTVSRGLHGTAVLLPDATVFIAGENREALVRPDDPSFPLGDYPRGDPDLGVPNGQIFRPPYLFNADGSPARRPVLDQGPSQIRYGRRFIVVVDNSRVDDIGSVVLLRSDHNTHQLTTGDRYVKLAYEGEDINDINNINHEQALLRVTAPVHPAQAIPGVYILFVVNRAGAPSLGKQVRLMLQE